MTISGFLMDNFASDQSSETLLTTPTKKISLISQWRARHPRPRPPLRNITCADNRVVQYHSLVHLHLLKYNKRHLLRTNPLLNWLPLARWAFQMMHRCFQIIDATVAHSVPWVIQPKSFQPEIIAPDNGSGVGAMFADTADSLVVDPKLLLPVVTETAEPCIADEAN